MDKPNRQARRANKEPSGLDNDAFVRVADKFIDLANRENQKVLATDLHMAFLYASARYTAFVAKNVLTIEEHEPFIAEMADTYREMLRQHLADPSLDPDLVTKN